MAISGLPGYQQFGLMESRVKKIQESKLKKLRFKYQPILYQIASLQYHSANPYFRVINNAPYTDPIYNTPIQTVVQRFRTFYGKTMNQVGAPPNQPQNNYSISDYQNPNGLPTTTQGLGIFDSHPQQDPDNGPGTIKQPTYYLNQNTNHPEYGVYTETRFSEFDLNGAFNELAGKMTQAKFNQIWIDGNYTSLTPAGWPPGLGINQFGKFVWLNGKLRQVTFNQVLYPNALQLTSGSNSDFGFDTTTYGSVPHPAPDGNFYPFSWASIATQSVSPANFLSSYQGQSNLYFANGSDGSQSGNNFSLVTKEQFKLLSPVSIPYSIMDEGVFMMSDGSLKRFCRAVSTGTVHQNQIIDIPLPPIVGNIPFFHAGAVAYTDHANIESIRFTTSLVLGTTPQQYASSRSATLVNSW